MGYYWAVAAIWHTEDSRGHILVLAFRQTSMKRLAWAFRKKVLKSLKILRSLKCVLSSLGSGEGFAPRVRGRGYVSYRGNSLIRNRPSLIRNCPLGPYSRTMPRNLWWS